MIIIGQVSDRDNLESKFEVQSPTVEEQTKNFSLFPEEKSLVICSNNKHKLVSLHYGLIPFWTSSNKKYFEAPVDGDGTSLTEPHKLKKRIINVPAFRKPVRETRCIIPVDYFILADEDRTVLFFTDERPFALAGVYDSWKLSYKDKELYEGFSILTLPAKGIFSECSFKNQPLILSMRASRRWLNQDVPLMEITSVMDYYDDKKINGYNLDPALLNKHLNDKSVIKPVGAFLRDNKFDSYSIIERIKGSRYKKGVTP